MGSAEGSKKIVDTEQHGVTSHRAADGSVKQADTTVWAFKDVRNMKASIYRGYEGLPWALTDLVRRTNSAIERGEIPGTQLSVGDTIQACVISYFDGEGCVHKPQTTDDSPFYATLPYVIQMAEGGHLTCVPDIPPEAIIHFALPVTVGDLIPTLERAQHGKVLVSLQLKEAAHKTVEEIEIIDKQLATAEPEEILACETSEQADAEMGDFLDYLASEAGPNAETQMMPNSKPSTEPAPSANDTKAFSPTTSVELKERLNSRAKKDMQDFGFGK